MINSKNLRAYTLIEILVGLTIIGLLFSFGYVGFRDFARRQALAGTIKKLQGDLRLSQAMALSGQKPDSLLCTGSNVLTSIDFKINSQTQYSVEANCTGGIVGIKTVNIASGITVSTPTPNPISFNVLGRGTNIPSGGSAAITLTQAGTNKQSNITITWGGEIK